jgi:hypothetical protein
VSRGWRHYFRFALWSAWLTALWAFLSLYLFHSPVLLPHAIELSVLLSAAAAFVGGCLRLAAKVSARAMTGDCTTRTGRHKGLPVQGPRPVLSATVLHTRGSIVPPIL